MSDILFSNIDAYYMGQPLHLTPMERRILKILWDHDFIGFTTTGWKKCPNTSMASMVFRVRAKLKHVGAPYCIRTVRREGYVLQPIIKGVNDQDYVRKNQYDNGEGEPHEQT